MLSTFSSFFRNCLSHACRCRTRKRIEIAMDDSQTGALEVRADGTSNHANDKINNHSPTLQILRWLKRVCVMCGIPLEKNIRICFKVYIYLHFTYICANESRTLASCKHYAARLAIFFNTNCILTEWCRVCYRVYVWRIIETNIINSFIIHKFCNYKFIEMLHFLSKNTEKEEDKKTYAIWMHDEAIINVFLDKFTKIRIMCWKLLINRQGCFGDR